VVEKFGKKNQIFGNVAFGELEKSSVCKRADGLKKTKI